MFSPKTTKALAVAAMTVAAGAAAVPASASTVKPHGFMPKSVTARPDSVGPECAFGSDASVCGLIQGANSYVSYMSIAACVPGAGMWLHGEIVSPSGHVYKNTANVYRSDGNCTAMLWNIYHDVNPGEWKFRFWEDNTNGTYTQLAQVELGVA
jgi:hypothetical protein